MPQQQRYKRTIFIVTGCVLTLAVAGFLALRYATPAPKPRILSAVDIQALRTRAEQGEVVAQRQLGAAYAKGNGVKQDYAEAAKWYRPAAEKGDAPAQGALGELHEAGQGVPHDEREAAKWYRRAADQGLVSAQYELAALYAVGNGVPLDDREALKWYLQAAEQGDPLSQYCAGRRLSEGRGVPRDLVQGYKWLRLAANQGQPDAAKALENLKDQLSSDQLATAKGLVKEFKPKVAGTRGLGTEHQRKGAASTNFANFREGATDRH